jgi:hypothetical protein
MNNLYSDDLDGDNISNLMDSDTDGDGVLDSIDSDPDGNGDSATMGWNLHQRRQAVTNSAIENSSLPGLIWSGQVGKYQDRKATLQWQIDHYEPVWGDWEYIGSSVPSNYNTNAYFKNDISFDVNPLRYTGLSYSDFAKIDDDDDGNFYFSRNITAGATAVSTTGGDYDTRWEQLMVDNGVGAFSGANMGLSATNYHALDSTWLEENNTFQDKTMGFYFHGTSGVLSGVTNPAGVRITGGLTIKTITGQDTQFRYYIDEYGDIYDRFGEGNSSPDFYDYVPDVATNEKDGYVGNIFGARRSARQLPMDANGNGRLDQAETLPVLKIAERNYNKPDEALKFRTDAAGLTTPLNLDPAAAGSNGLMAISTYNPGFAGVYLGFTEQNHTTIGVGAVDIDAYGRSLNTVTVQAFRTLSSTSTPANPTSGNDAIDRDYGTIAVGSKVRILDGSGLLIDGAAAISARQADGSYVITASPGVTLDPHRTYRITSETDADAPITEGARLGGSQTNSLAQALSAVLRGNDYRLALMYGLLDDLTLSAAATDPWGDQMSGKLTISWNKKQERLEIYQNAYAAVAKAGSPGS